MGPHSNEAYTPTRTLEDGSHGLESFSIPAGKTEFRTTYRSMRSFHSTTAWSTSTGLLLVWHSAPSAFTVTWKPAGMCRRPRARSVVRMAGGNHQYGLNGDKYHIPVMTTCCTPLRCISPASWTCPVKLSY